MDLTKVCAAPPEGRRVQTTMRPRTPLALLLLVLLSLGMGGCLFDHPLTEMSSTNIDTRLLGVFEFSEVKPAKTPAGQLENENHPIIHRVAVLPLDNSRYIIYYRDFSKKPAQVLKYIGWISRVDNSYYLTFLDQTEGSGTFGKYGFFYFQWLFPGDFRLFAPNLKDVDTASSSYKLRAAVRKALKAGTLFPYEATAWRKIARIWWDPEGAATGTTIPPEFEKGTTRDHPGL
jgi:hypothetical protein